MSGRRRAPRRLQRPSARRPRARSGTAYPGGAPAALSHKRGNKPFPVGHTAMSCPLSLAGTVLPYVTHAKREAHVNLAAKCKVKSAKALLMRTHGAHRPCCLHAAAQGQRPRLEGRRDDDRVGRVRHAVAALHVLQQVRCRRGRARRALDMEADHLQARRRVVADAVALQAALHAAARLAAQPAGALAGRPCEPVSCVGLCRGGSGCATDSRLPRRWGPDRCLARHRRMGYPRLHWPARNAEMDRGCLPNCSQRPRQQ